MSLTLPIDGVGGTILCIILVSISFTFTFSAAGTPRLPEKPQVPKKTPPNRIARATQWKASRAQIVARQQRISQCVASNGFPFGELPPEIQLMILAYASEWIPTYQALIRVSHHMYGLTLRACLPHMPVALSTTKQITSFAHLLASDIPQVYLHHSRLYVANLVHRLWISALRKEDKDLGIEILRTCINVRVLACDARTLRAAIAKPSKFRHTRCRDLTLLLSRPGWDVSLNTPTGLAFLQRLTHLRVMGEKTVPKDLCSAKLTHLSYSDRHGYDELTVDRPWALGHPDMFPSLREVVLTRRCGPEGRTLERIGPRLVVCYVSRQWTEMQMWCDTAKGGSLWDQAGIRLQGCARPR
jgi:hypothetical protein